MDSSPANVLGASCWVRLPPTQVYNVLVQSFSNCTISMLPGILSKCALEFSRSGVMPDAGHCSPAFPGDAKADLGPFEKQSPIHDSQMGGLAQPKSHHPGGQKRLGFWKTLTSSGH